MSKEPFINEASVNDRRASTYHQFTLPEETLGGRYRKLEPQTIVGSNDPIPSYTRSAPWSSTQLPDEPPSDLKSTRKSRAGKQTVIDLTKECLEHAGVKTMIGPNRFKSGPGLVRWVSENRVSLCVQDEFGKLLAKIGNQKANVSELEINERMRELWGLGPESVYNGPVGAGKDDNMVAIKEPHLNILGVGVREEFYSVCSDTDQVNGFLNRLDLLEEPRMVRPRDVDHVQQFPFKLITQLSKLHSLKRQRLPWTKGAKEIWEAELDRVYSQTDERKIKLWARTPERIVMAATVFACCRFAKQVERSDMETAQAFLRLSDEVFKRGIDDAEQTRVLDYAQLKIEIERRVHADYPTHQATEAQILRSFRHNTKYKHAVKDALEDMLASGTFERVVLRTGGPAVFRRPKE